MAPNTRKGKGRNVTTAGELAAAGQLDADSDFAFASLSALDSSVRCAICSELYTAPVILTHCGHSFDSRCLAEHFVIKRSCPTCHREAFHDHTVRNQALSELVESWRAARSDLLELQARAARNASPEAGSSSRDGNGLANGGSESQQQIRTDSAATKDGKRQAALSSSSPAPRAVKREKLEDASSDIEILEEIPVDRKPSKRPRTRRRDPEQESTPPFATADPTDPNLVVECPLCGRSLKNGLMSGHLDRCTGKPSTTTGARPDAGPSQAWSKLMSTSNGSRSGAGSNTKDGSSTSANAGDMDLSKKLPLGSYQHKKSAQLVKMLKDYGLPTDSPNGLSPEAKVTHLQRRHRQFVILWNANADLDPGHPARKTAKQLRSELRRWEDDQDRAEGKGEIAEDHAVKYAEQYRELIAQARASHEKAKKAKEEAAAQASETHRSKTPEAAAPLTKEEKEAAPPSREEDQPEQRKKSVRVVSPPPPRTSSHSPAVIGSAEPRASGDSDSTGSSSPLLPSSPLLADDNLEEEQSRGASIKRRTPSPFDPAGPRPSQRNREEERMFAELYGDRAADESLQAEQDSGPDAG